MARLVAVAVLAWISLAATARADTLRLTLAPARVGDTIVATHSSTVRGNATAFGKTQPLDQRDAVACRTRVLRVVDGRAAEVEVTVGTKTYRVVPGEVTRARSAEVHGDPATPAALVQAEKDLAFERGFAPILAAHSYSRGQRVELSPAERRAIPLLDGYTVSSLALTWTGSSGDAARFDVALAYVGEGGAGGQLAGTLTVDARSGMVTAADVTAAVHVRNPTVTLDADITARITRRRQ